MRPLRLASFAASVLLAACASTAKLEAPRLSLIGANMTSADVFSQQFRVKVHVDNPNARALPIKSLEYRLFLEGDSFADGRSEAPFIVPANGSQDFDLLVRTQFVSSIGRLLSRLAGTDRQEIQYLFSGTLVLDLPFSPKLKFNEGGMVNLQRR